MAALYPNATWIRRIDRLGGSQEPKTPAQQQHSRRMLFAQGASHILVGLWLLAFDLTATGQRLRGNGFGPSFYFFVFVIPFLCYLPIWIVALKGPR